MRSITSPRGFSLLETVVATSVLVTALAGVAQLLVLSARWARTAAGANGALLLAQQKLEELRTAPFTYDESGNALTAPVVSVSPSASLADDVPPFVDWFDASGHATDAAGRAVLTRRWRVSLYRSGPPDAITIEVCVYRAHQAEPESCLSTIRTRQP